MYMTFGRLTGMRQRSSARPTSSKTRERQHRKQLEVPFNVKAALYDKMLTYREWTELWGSMLHRTSHDIFFLSPLVPMRCPLNTLIQLRLRPGWTGSPEYLCNWRCCCSWSDCTATATRDLTLRSPWWRSPVQTEEARRSFVSGPVARVLSVTEATARGWEREHCSNDAFYCGLPEDTESEEPEGWRVKWPLNLFQKWWVWSSYTVTSF